MSNSYFRIKYYSSTLACEARSSLIFHKLQRCPVCKLRLFSILPIFHRVGKKIRIPLI